MPAQTDGRVRKYLRKRKFNKNEVLRVFTAVMENQNAATTTASTSSGEERKNDYHNEFFNTGRIGRRNALPDILGYNCTTTTADLPSRLSALTTDDTRSSAATPSTSGTSCVSSSGGVVDRNAPSTSQASCSSSTQPVDETMNTT